VCASWLDCHFCRVQTNLQNTSARSTFPPHHHPCDTTVRWPYTWPKVLPLAVAYFFWQLYRDWIFFDVWGRESYRCTCYRNFVPCGLFGCETLRCIVKRGTQIVAEYFGLRRRKWRRLGNGVSNQQCFVLVSVDQSKREMVRTKAEEVTGDSRVLHTEELHDSWFVTFTGLLLKAEFLPSTPLRRIGEKRCSSIHS